VLVLMLGIGLTVIDFISFLILLAMKILYFKLGTAKMIMMTKMITRKTPEATIIMTISHIGMGLFVLLFNLIFSLQSFPVAPIQSQKGTLVKTHV